MKKFTFIILCYFHYYSSWKDKFDLLKLYYYEKNKSKVRGSYYYSIIKIIFTRLFIHVLKKNYEITKELFSFEKKKKKYFLRMFQKFRINGFSPLTNRERTESRNRTRILLLLLPVCNKRQRGSCGDESCVHEWSRGDNPSQNSR